MPAFSRFLFLLAHLFLFCPRRLSSLPFEFFWSLPAVIGGWPIHADYLIWGSSFCSYFLPLTIGSHDAFRWYSTMIFVSFQTLVRPSAFAVFPIFSWALQPTFSCHWFAFVDRAFPVGHPAASSVFWINEMTNCTLVSFLFTPAATVLDIGSIPPIFVAHLRCWGFTNAFIITFFGILSG